MNCQKQDKIVQSTWISYAHNRSYHNSQSENGQLSMGITETWRYKKGKLFETRENVSN